MQNASTIKSCDFSYSRVWFILLAFLISEPLHFHILFLIFKYWSTCHEWSIGREGSGTTGLWNCSVNASLPFSLGKAFPAHPPPYYSCPWWLNISAEQLCGICSSETSSIHFEHNLLYSFLGNENPSCRFRPGPRSEILGRINLPWQPNPAPRHLPAALHFLITFHSFPF